MRPTIGILAAILLVASLGGAQEEFAVSKETREVATKAMATFSELITEKNFARMGFDSPGEIREAALGVPMRVFMVRLDRLQEYEPGRPPDPLLTSIDVVIYPVTVKEQTRSSVTIGKIDERWVAMSYGSPNLTGMLTRTRQANADASKLDASAYFVVRIPALNLYFIAHHDREVLILTPVLNDPDYGFEAGTAMPATKVFEAVLPAAKKHDGLPG